MDQVHPLLHFQLKRHVGNDQSMIDTWHAFLGAVNEAYIEFDGDRLLLEHALELSSQELFQINQELHGILHAIPDRLFRIDAQNKIIDLAQEGRVLAHLPAQDGRNEPPEGDPPGLALHFWDAIQQVRETQALVSFEYSDCSEDQERFYEVRLIPFAHLELIGIIRDITVRKRAEQALLVSEAQARQAEADLLRIKRTLEAEREKLHHLATRDGLTDLWNRRAIFELLSSEIARAERAGSPVTVIMVDVDKFKSINDLYGHPVGDIVLQETARRLNSCIRASDKIGRYGGEEFLIILVDCDTHTVFSRAEQFRKIIESEPISIAEDTLHVTCSLGVSWTGEIAYDSDRLVQAADAALYEAKRAGRNRVELASMLWSNAIASSAE